jgi:carboxymethylenebutenolidase
MPITARPILDTPDGPMPAYTASPDDGGRGGIVVVQEAFGVTTHIEDIVDRLAEAGWHAIAPAFFHRQGSPVIAYDDLTAVMPVMGQLTAAGITTDLSAAFDYLEGAGFTAARTGVVGFCMGGSVSFQAAVLRPLGAAVTFYGGGVAEGRFGFPALIEAAPSLQTPWLGLYGDLDQGIPVSDVETLRQSASGADVATEIIRYADAQHGFNCDDRPGAFNRPAAADAWGHTLAWFDRHLSAGA